MFSLILIQISATVEDLAGAGDMVEERFDLCYRVVDVCADPAADTCPPSRIIARGTHVRFVVAASHLSACRLSREMRTV